MNRLKQMNLVMQASAANHLEPRHCAAFFVFADKL